MNDHLSSYGTLCSLFYDATEKFALDDEVDFFASCIAQKNGRTLEAMSGSGRLQIPLLLRGFAVEGVDNSPAMLQRLRERCSEYNLQPVVYEQSVLDLHLPCKYSTVIIAVASFQLIVGRENAIQMLKQLRAHMEPGGDLLIDLYMPDYTDDVSAVRVAHLDDSRIIRQSIRYLFDKEAQVAHGYCTYDLLVNGNLEQQEQELISLAWYSDAQIAELLDAAGFELMKFYDHPYGNGSARVVHARKV